MVYEDTLEAIIDGEDAQVVLELEPCPYCDRKFSKLSRHVKVCRKLSKKSRPVFDSSKQRLSGISESDKILVNPVSPLAVKEPKEVKIEPRPPDEKIWNRTKSYVMGLKDRFIHPKTKPRSNSISAVMSEPPRAKSETTVVGRIPENYVQCPSCDRWFGPKAADRHIEWCTSKLFRMPAGNVPSPTEKKRWENRVSYKAPLPGKNRLENRQKYGFGAPQIRIARGFSPPKADQQIFDRSGFRRTSLRGRQFGETKDPLAYALGRQESPVPKQKIKRFLSSSTYRAEPDGIDHAVLSKSSSRPDGLEFHRSLLHENAARQLEELLMSSSTCSLGDLPLGSSSMSRSMPSASLMSTSLGPDSSYFTRLGSGGKSKIPVRSPSPHSMLSQGPASMPSDEFLLNELMASNLLSPPPKASPRKSAAPLPSLQEMLYGSGSAKSNTASSAQESRSNSTSERDLLSTKSKSLGDGEEAEESGTKGNRSLDLGLMQTSQSLSSASSTPGSTTSSRGTVIEVSQNTHQSFARQDTFTRESADGNTDPSPPRASSPTKPAANPTFANIPETSSSLFPAKSSAPAPIASNYGLDSFKLSSNQRQGSRVGENKGYQVQPTGGMKTAGLGVQPKARAQDFFSSGMLGLNSKRITKMASIESDDDIIMASHNVVTNIASEMGSLALFDNSSRHRSLSGHENNSLPNSGQNSNLPSPKRENNSFAAGMTNSGSAPKFCHECGSKYPVSLAKFCCNCGARRVC